MTQSVAIQFVLLLKNWFPLHSAFLHPNHSLLPLKNTQTMCPHANGEALPNDTSNMVPVDTNGPSSSRSNGVRANGNTTHPREQQKRNPYAPRASDFLSNISNFNIIESTLRGQSLLDLCTE